MTVVNDISDVYLEQIFPEPSLSGNERRFVFLYAIGLGFSDIATLCRLHPDTVRKTLYSASEKFLDCSNIHSLRTITLIRVFSMVGYHTLNKAHTLF
ncbi:hypothetical protein D9G28_23870 [Escherichia coli]|jgi:hypothetical protein|nr:hypothetical protein [Escherichia coli]EEW1450415.1 hypothetical protein [Escherichia coli]EEW1919020.1 hypothetical protein [Escherichia coli]EEW2138949.1 hypothetical protein [Escherichia coli]EFN5265320.1 hypothetical protein [Escherichia coli]